MIFVDTSAFYAAADINDQFHTKAKIGFEKVLAEELPLITHNLIVVETVALAHRRMGKAVANKFLDSLDAFELIWINQEIFETSTKRFQATKDKDISLVDVVSFTVMQQNKLTRFLGFDGHFEDAGFRQY